MSSTKSNQPLGIGVPVSLDKGTLALVENKPSKPIDFYSEASSCSLGEKTTQVLAVGGDAVIAKILADDALSLAQKLVDNGTLEGIHNGTADAFRHAYWSCRMAKWIGWFNAHMVGDIHEACGKGPPNETKMDKHNNAVGRSISSLFEDCESACLKALKDGMLIISPGSEPSSPVGKLIKYKRRK